MNETICNEQCNGGMFDCCCTGETDLRNDTPAQGLMHVAQQLQDARLPAA